MLSTLIIALSIGILTGFTFLYWVVPAADRVLTKSAERVGRATFLASELYATIDATQLPTRIGYFIRWSGHLYWHAGAYKQLAGNVESAEAELDAWLVPDEGRTTAAGLLNLCVPTVPEFARYERRIRAQYQLSCRRFVVTYIVLRHF